MLDFPLISAVIPTRNRPILLHRAILSALNQTYSHLEVVVIIDGEDPATLTSLSGLTDPRLHVIALPESVGGAEARNIGARTARGKWIAFLDDDDEWLPTKLEKQLAAAEAIPGEYIFVASRFIERSEGGDRILPARSIKCEGPFSDFLFCRDKIGGGTGYVQTSTWFVSKALLAVTPFTKGLKRNQDVDWMLHAMAVPECKLKILEEPLSIFHEDKRSGRVSKQADWKFHYEWAIRNRAFLSPKAFSYCMATLCVPEAIRQQAPLSTLLKLLKEAFANGQMTRNCLLFFLYNWWFPESLRHTRRMRAAVKIA
jgi:glycosyltransferase involved in cell wall biosynthesis